MAGISSFLDANSRTVNVTTNILLSILIALSYLLVLILFFWPSAFVLESLVTPSVKGIKPTTAVTLIAAVLIAATSALVTRCVDQTLWLKLTPRTVKRPITVGESRRLAGWSVSPVKRLQYLFDGDYMLLKIAGPLLVATAIVSPVLVSGISQTTSRTVTIANEGPNGDVWSGWVDAANSGYNGGNFQDVPGIVAALAYLNNLSAPASPVCSEAGCSVSATASAIQATCQTGNELQTIPMYNHESANFTYSSSYNPEINVVLSAGAPYTYANFTSFYAKGCDTTDLTACVPGTFAVIFGAFVNGTQDATGPEYVNIVDCLLAIGTAVVIQQGGSTPVVSTGSFVQNSSAQFDGYIVPLRRIYTDSNYRSPYYFTASTGTGDAADSLYNSPIATMLLGPDATTSGVQVAQRIEAIFNLATLMAFSRSPYTSPLTITTTVSAPVYIYDVRVLAILLVSFLATVFGMWGRWRVTGKDVFVGYDPIEIARRGPIMGISEASDVGTRGALDGKKVWAVRGNQAEGVGLLRLRA